MAWRLRPGAAPPKCRLPTGDQRRFRLSDGGRLPGSLEVGGAVRQAAFVNVRRAATLPAGGFSRYSPGDARRRSPVASLRRSQDVGEGAARRRPPSGRSSVQDASVINCVAVTAGADTDRAVIEALIEDREGIPVGTAVVQPAIGTEKRCQLRVDPAQRHRVGRVAADDLLDRVQGGRVGEPAGRAEEVIHDEASRS